MLPNPNEEKGPFKGTFYTIKYIDGLSSDALENDRYQKKGLFNVYFNPI